MLETEIVLKFLLLEPQTGIDLYPGLKVNWVPGVDPELQVNYPACCGHPYKHHWRQQMINYMTPESIHKLFYCENFEFRAPVGGALPAALAKLKPEMCPIGSVMNDLLLIKEPAGESLNK